MQRSLILISKVISFYLESMKYNAVLFGEHLYYHYICILSYRNDNVHNL